MPKEEVLSAEDVIRLVSGYMGEEHVAFVRRACAFAEKDMKDKYANLVRFILCIRFKLQGF